MESIDYSIPRPVRHRLQELLPDEPARIVQLLVERIAVRVDGLEISLRVEVLASIVENPRRREPERRAA